MAIITISRQIAALGDETAHELTKMLGWRVVDRASLEDRFAAHGFTDKKLGKFDEKKPSFWASLSQERDDYLHYLRSAMLEEAVKGDCVIIGRGAAFIFKDIPGTVSVRLVATPEVRIERVKSYFRCDERRAKQIIEQSDRDREGFHRYFFNVDWTCASNYHMVMNTGSIHPTTAAGIVKDLQALILTPEAANESQARLREFVLSQEVVTAILYSKRVPIHFLEAACSSGSVILRGVANSSAAVEIAVQCAREVPGVSDVRSEIQVVQEYSIMP